MEVVVEEKICHRTLGGRIAMAWKKNLKVLKDKMVGELGAMESAEEVGGDKER